MKLILPNEYQFGVILHINIEYFVDIFKIRTTKCCCKQSNIILMINRYSNSKQKHVTGGHTIYYEVWDLDMEGFIIEVKKVGECDICQ